jgi:hypothetical protein
MGLRMSNPLRTDVDRIDPKRGVGGVLLMQYLPFYGVAALRTLCEFEAAVCEYLAPPPQCLIGCRGPPESAVSRDADAAMGHGAS